ncbi:MAG TPA: hypothetical protein VK574_21330 [Terracidiphilus sp.]|nr:hypothetical protein [Terracidiphilus sp.]
MRRTFALLCTLLLAFTATPALADIAAIHADALPQETSVLAALDDARQLEPYAGAWTNKWDYALAKKDVADRLEKDLGFLTAALLKHPDNEELALLTGLVAHYAYNVDVPDSHEKAIAALEAARKLAPNDTRASWFHANLLCQTLETKPGAKEFLAIEAAHAWDQLPPTFWRDYMTCAAITGMPAHVLRAGSYLDKLHVPPSPTQTFLVDTARNRFDTYDPKKEYQPKEVWHGEKSGDGTQFTATLCGARLVTPGNWSVNQLDFNNGSCAAWFFSGPYKAVARNLQPSILLMVQQAPPGQSLGEYAKKFTHKGKFEPFAPSRCPATACLAMKGVQPGMYKADGDGHGHILVFERDEPEFPGLLFESPWEPPKTDPDKGTQYFHPSQTQKRIPGKLFYVVIVDMAASIEAPSMKDYELFLKDLTVE